jgi:hypothetical protein
MKYLSEDDMWKSLMEEQKILTPELTETECFWKIFAKGNYLFWQNLKKKMNQISESEGKNTVLFLDKIIYPDTLEPILKRLRTE